MKDGLVRTREKNDKPAIFERWHWMHFLDLQQLDRWLQFPEQSMALGVLLAPKAGILGVPCTGHS